MAGDRPDPPRALNGSDHAPIYVLTVCRAGLMSDCPVAVVLSISSLHPSGHARRTTPADSAAWLP